MTDVKMTINSWRGEKGHRQLSESNETMMFGEIMYLPESDMILGYEW